MDFDFTTETITPDTTTVLTIGSTGALEVPTGTTAQRPVGVNGLMRYNTDTAALDFFTAGAWQAPMTTSGTPFSFSSSIAQGDILYGSAANVLTTLPKDTNATRYLSNTGATNNPAWAQVNLANGVSGRLPFANLTQIAGLSVLAVTGTGTADVAAVTGTAAQVLVVNNAGTALTFSSLDLSQAATVGTSRLAYANITQGTARSVWGVTGNATADHADIQGTADQVLRVNSAGTALAFGQVNLASTNAVTGTLGTGNGGTGNANGTIPLDKITAAGAANSINNGDNAQTWNWALTTAAKAAFTFTENTAATNGAGSQFLVDISTIAASTANPIRIRAQANNILTVTNVGVTTLQGADTGTGSAITIKGGNSTTAATGGANATLLGGTSGTSGTGGVAAVTGGVGGTTGVGGAANITGGAGGSTSGNAGGVTITGGTPVAGAGGSITISGSAGVGTNQAGGGLTLSGGNPTGTGTPGSISLTAGALQGAGTPATITITGGAGNGSTTGGAVTVTAGSGGSTGTGAAVTIRGGPGGSTSGNAGTVTVTGGTPVAGTGGAVTLSGSAGVGTNQAGGDASVTGGAATGTGVSGNVNLTGGTAGGAGTGGSINLAAGSTAAGTNGIILLGTTATRTLLRNGNFAGAGDAQAGVYIMRTQTTNATITEAFLDGTGGTARIVLPNNSAYSFFIQITARRTDATGGRAAYQFSGLIYRDANAASTAIQGGVTKTIVAESNVAWDASVDADTTNGSLRVQVTGEAAKTIRWVVTVRTTEVTN